MFRVIGDFFNKTASLIGWIFILGFAAIIVIVAIGLNAVKDKAPGLIDFGGERAVAVIELKGEIGDMINASDFREQLMRQVRNPHIQGIVVRVESPGGTVGASEEIFHTIKKARETKPVVCSLGDIAASGGLYVAMGCERIITNRGTLTGSIGVIMMIPNFSSIMTRFDLEMNVVKSGNLKDAGSPFKKFADSDREFFQRLVAQTHEQFVKAVSESRGLSVDQVKQFADGRILLGEEAVELKLVDEVGDTYRAAQVVLERKGIAGEPSIVYPERKRGLQRFLDSMVESKIFTFLKSRSGVELRYEMLI